jgi:hypothetical protein
MAVASYFQAELVFAANSVKLVGFVPVAVSTWSLGWDPFPLAIVAVSVRRTSPY